MSCSAAWRIPFNKGPRLRRMMILTARAATASTNGGSPTLNVYDIPAAIKTAVLRSVSAKTCCLGKDNNSLGKLETH